MRYTIEKESEVRQLAESGKSSAYIASLTGIPERVIWKWCPDTRPHDNVIMWSIKQRCHSIIPELEARISAAVSPIVRSDITEEEWDNLNSVIYKTLFDEAVIVFKDVLDDPPDFSAKRELSTEPFLDYLKRFWSENSEYVKRKNLSPVYVKQNHDSIHFWSLMKKRKLSEINSGDIERVFENLSDKGLSQSRINAIMKVALIPLKEAFKEGSILSRCYEFYLPKVEKSENNLSTIDAVKIFNSSWENKEAFVANLVAYICKMQLQEVRALRLQDIGEKTITVENYYTRDGLVKNRKPRVINTSSYITSTIMKYASTAPYSDFSPTDFVFFSESRLRPASGRCWNYSLQKICKKNNIEPFNFRMWSV